MKSLTKDNLEELRSDFKAIVSKIDFAWYAAILGRWEDEKEHEDWKDYEKVIKEKFSFLEDLKVSKKKLTFSVGFKKIVGTINISDGNIVPKLEFVKER